MYRWLISLSVACILLRNSNVEAYQKFDWAYGDSIGPTAWKKNYPACGGSHQSPINIETKDVFYDPSLSPFEVKLEGPERQYTIKNLGLNVEIFFENTTWLATFKGSKEYCYQLLQVHFHWGSDNTKGSEHQVNGKKYPLEAHIVMWNCRLYKSASVAAGSVNGLAVMGILFEVNDAAANPAIIDIISALSTIDMQQCPCSTYKDIVKEKMGFFDINKLLPENRKDFYRYQGSLTTPPCTENVLWSVFRETQKISNRQLNSFRNLLNRKKSNGGILNMYNNFRPVNPLNPRVPINSRRVVTASFASSSMISPSIFTALISVLSVITAVSINEKL